MAVACSRIGIPYGDVMNMDIGEIIDVIITFNNAMDDAEKETKRTETKSRKARPGESIRTILGG
jgi:hypothetical protein